MKSFLEGNYKMCSTSKKVNQKRNQAIQGTEKPTHGICEEASQDDEPTEKLFQVEAVLKTWEAVFK